jgi:hypothetical protein
MRQSQQDGRQHMHTNPGLSAMALAIPQHDTFGNFYQPVPSYWQCAHTVRGVSSVLLTNLERFDTRPTPIAARTVMSCL